MDQDRFDYERAIQEVYETVLPEGAVAVDVGAHLGRHTIPLARAVGGSGRVLAFEPLPMCRDALARELREHHPELLPRVDLAAQALSDFQGETEFVVARDALAYSGLKRRIYDWKTTLDKIPVRVTRLDDCCRQLPRLDFIKIDAEGGELGIVRGAEACLHRFRPLVVFEFGAYAIGEYGITPGDMAAFWVRHGYQVYSIIGELLSPEAFQESATVQDLCDYVAIPAENKELEQTVVRVLTRTSILVHWHKFQLNLKLVRQTAATDKVPALSQLGRFTRWLGQWFARCLLTLSKFIVRRQKYFNQGTIQLVNCLAANLRSLENQVAEQQARIEKLEGRLAGQEAPRKLARYPA